MTKLAGKKRLYLISIFLLELCLFSCSLNVNNNKTKGYIDIIITKEKTSSTQTGYVGADRCKNCHLREYKKWLTTKHALSYKTLVARGEEKTSKCLRCHATSYDDFGGFINTEKTPALANVSCEACHGPGADHIMVEKKDKRITIYGINENYLLCDLRRVCLTCHTSKYSPLFQIQEALKKVDCRID